MTPALLLGPQDSSTGRALLADEFPYLSRVVSLVASRLPAHLRDECESEALCAMVEAADAWQEGLTPFRKFVAQRIHMRMIDEARAASAYSRVTNRSRLGYSLDTLASANGENDETHADRLVATGPASVDPHSRLLAKEQLERFGEMPQRWKLAVLLDREEATRALGVSTHRIDQLRRKTRDAMVSGAPLPREPKPKEGAPLSPTEVTILRAAAQGQTNEMIAESLGRSTGTIKEHLKSLTVKLGARSRTHAVHLAWQAGWWQHGPPRVRQAA